MVNVILVDDEQLTELNKQFLNRDYKTDVITFTLSAGDAELLEGEIYVSIDRILANARKYQIAPTEEFNRIVVHGLLHLLGYEDGSTAEKERMTERENHYLNNTPNHQLEG